MSAITPPKGRNFIRALLLRRHLGIGANSALDPMIAEAASRHWGAQHDSTIAKAAVTSITSSNHGTDPAASEFFSLVREQSAYGRLAGLRKVPFNLRVLATASGATGYR